MASRCLGRPRRRSTEDRQRDLHRQTIHDVSFEGMPGLLPRLTKLRPKLMVRLSAKRSAAVIMISEFTRSRISQHYGIDPGRIFVTPPRGRSLAARSAGPIVLLDKEGRRFCQDRPLFFEHLDSAAKRLQLLAPLRCQALGPAGSISACLIQRRRDSLAIPKSWATPSMGWPVSTPVERPRRTASDLNSAGYASLLGARHRDSMRCPQSRGNSKV